jgi:hypothetical protein
MTFRLWDTDINRLFGAFDLEGEALSAAKSLIDTDGEAYADDLALGCEWQDGSFAPPLTGPALLRRLHQLQDVEFAAYRVERLTGT